MKKRTNSKSRDGGSKSDRGGQAPEAETKSQKRRKQSDSACNETSDGEDDSSSVETGRSIGVELQESILSILSRREIGKTC